MKSYAEAVAELESMEKKLGLKGALTSYLAKNVLQQELMSHDEQVRLTESYLHVQEGDTFGVPAMPRVERTRAIHSVGGRTKRQAEMPCVCRECEPGALHFKKERNIGAFGRLEGREQGNAAGVRKGVSRADALRKAKEGAGAIEVQSEPCGEIGPEDYWKYRNPTARTHKMPYSREAPELTYENIGEFIAWIERELRWLSE